MSNPKPAAEVACPDTLPIVAIVAPSLDILGGQSIQAANLVSSLVDEGYEIVFLPSNPRFPTGLGWIRQIPFLRTVVNQFFYVLSLRKLRQVEVVHVFSASYWSFLLQPVPAIVAARLFKKRTVLNYHSGEAEDHLQHWGRRVHPWLAKVDDIVVPSNYLKSVFENFGYRSTVVFNIVITSSFKFRRRQPLQPIFFSNRNLELIYGIENSLRAFALVKKIHPQARLVIAGAGSQAQALKDWVACNALAGVEFVGRISPQDMPAYFAAAHIFLNSSLVDNQPLSILEAFAAGCPVVSTPTGDIPAMVREGITGRLVPHNDPQAMAAAILELLEDQDQSATMATAALAQLENYTWALQRDKWRQVYSGAER